MEYVKLIGLLLLLKVILKVIALSQNLFFLIPYTVIIESLKDYL